MSTINTEKNVCLVCSVETNSIHNSVNSCRACSAFFRRGIINHKTFRCRRGNKNCVMKPGDKLFCKYCRFQKCKAVGMVLKNVSNDLSNNVVFSTNINEETDIDRSTITSPSNEELPLHGDIKIEDNKVLLDMKKINCYVNNVFSTTNSSLDNIDTYTTCLQRVIIGIKNLFSNLNYNHPEKVVFAKQAELRRFIKSWQNFITFSPSLLMSLKEFANLSLKDKWTIFRTFWRHAFIFLSSVYITKIKNPWNEALIICDETRVLKLSDAEIVEPDMDGTKSKEAFSLMKPTLILLHEFLHKPMRDYNYDEIEIAYIIVQMIFDKLTLHETAKECQNTGEKILKVVNDEIHNYYMYNKKMYNYAFRITEMTKLLLFIKEYSTRQKEITLMSKWMNIIDLSFMDSI